jgi:hypothetical protein
MLYLHRAFFARAVLKHPDDPLKSEYAYSFQAVLRSARDTIAWLEVIMRQAPAMCARIHYVWNIAASAAVSLFSNQRNLVSRVLDGIQDAT